MLRWFAALALLALPGAQACSDAFAAASLDLEFTKPCKRDAVADCPPVPAADEPYQADGILVWSWEVDAQCGLAIPSPSPIHIHLTGAERQFAGWLQVTAEPSEVTLEPTDQWDLTDDDIDPVTGRVIMREEVPVRVTIALVGEPSADALRMLESRDGLVAVDLRAVSGATDTFLAATEIEGFLLDGREALETQGDDAGSRDVPGFGPALALLVVALAALVRRA